MAKCPDCHGTGVILLFTSATPCSSCGGSGRERGEQPPIARTATEKPDYRGAAWSPSEGDTQGSIVIRGGESTGSGGSITITGGTAGGSGLGGDVTFATGTASSGTRTFTDATSSQTSIFTVSDGTQDYLTANSTGLHFRSAASPQVSFFTGATSPNNEPPTASRGSLYFQDDGASGTLWMKVSAEEWAPLALQQKTTAVTNDAVQQALHDVVNDDFAWLTDAILKNNETRHDEDCEYPEGLINMIPCIAPVHTAVLADMMALLEQEDEEVTAFVSSPRDFADIRKFAQGGHVQWKGKEVTVYGVPVIRSRTLPVGYMAAVSESRKYVLVTITR